MKPQARIESAIEILENIETAPVPMDTCVGDYMRHRRYIGSKDRLAVVNYVYNIMRARARLGWWLDKYEREHSPRNYVTAYLVLVQKHEEKRMKDMYDGSKYSPEPLSKEEAWFVGKLVGQELEHPNMPDTVRCECPPELEATLREYFGDDFETELSAMIEGAQLDLRANIWSSSREEAKASLEKDGVETDETPYSPWGLRARKKVHLSKTKALIKGYIQIQDEGSQLIAHVCNVKPGMQVLDYCAGAGGKTLALAAAMQRKGRLVAMDNDPRRLAKGKERFKKSGLADIIEVRPVSEERHRKWLRRQKGTFDVTLLDVPCSGTGTWRRNPDLRWYQHGPKLPELLVTQREILEKVANTVKPGGTLVYATCSLLPEENEKQIEEFLKKHPEYTLENVDPKLGSSYMRLTAKTHSTDGFFAAVMKRKEA